ncbi:hypothetical protein POVCU2_0051700 [Plasmodium ovale curtisi]|uniref:Uncharacterized protein n=1 Tax=Plasmodium ovale curtisi TaxID=864141 RepID=A0A1A8X0B1_PLAOA|nr:hypothetical protein POVCU2_0051700 [Plasmodium ovale curtisi]SBS98679.1 hypothetical protein POVCU1_047950 [Plasmodium ovale curtisi]
MYEVVLVMRVEMQKDVTLRYAWDACIKLVSAKKIGKVENGGNSGKRCNVYISLFMCRVFNSFEYVQKK